MRKYIYLILIGFLCLTGCPGVNGVDKRASGESRLERTNVLYEGTGLTAPHSEL
jgi:hypothetical protein